MLKINTNKLLIKNDIPTVKMMKFYRIYASVPFDNTAKTLFEYSFYSWYRENLNSIQGDLGRRAKTE